jgi:hypothetical protein
LVDVSGLTAPNNFKLWLTEFNPTTPGLNVYKIYSLKDKSNSNFVGLRNFKRVRSGEIIALTIVDVPSQIYGFCYYTGITLPAVAPSTPI